MLRRLVHSLSNANSWLVFLPFLLLYAVLSLVTSPHDQLVLDEGRYWGFAENLLNGHFHYKEGYQFLWSGPGYPLLLVPFVAMDSPIFVLKLVNALLLYVSVVYFFKLLKLYLAPSRALLTAVLFACYYPMYEVGLPYLMTEAWSMFLSVMATYLICKAFRFKDYRWGTLLLPGFLLGMLALTKVIFGYVLLVMIVLCLLVWLLRGRSRRMWSMSKIFLFAMAFCLPYLAYTYSLTGQVFYWGNAGGLQLYWMSTPYEHELGDWHVPTLEEDTILMHNHGAYFASIEHLSPQAKDAELKRKAIEQIKAHPKKFLYNWIANVSRTFCSYPLSFLEPSNGYLKYAVPNVFLIVFMVIMALPTLRYYKRFPLEILVLLVFALVYLGAISVMASYPRFLFMVVPIFMLWIAWGLHKFVRLHFESAQDTDAKSL
jgi:Dolichyl-phosphate-mannose-protein mannosyltransferase